MSDENDAASGEPSETPTTPDAGAEGAESPTQPQAAPPAASEPVTAAPVDEPVTVADPPAEAPTQVAPPAAASAGAAAAAPTAPATAAASDAKGRGVFVPAWVAVVVGVLLIAGLGFAVGWIAAPGDDGNPTNAAATSPSRNGSSNGNSSSSGNGNSQNTPSNGNGSSSDDSAGDSNGDSTTPPLQRGAYLGVSVESAANNGGATITSVAAGSPAASAGLKQGDVVTAVDGTQVTSALDLVRQIRQHEVNDSITVTYTRNGSSADAKVTLESRPTAQSVG